MTAYTREKGLSAERFALALYQKARFEILAHDHHYGHFQVDLIAKRSNILHFIEVKYRETLTLAYQSVSKAQLARIAQSAEAYFFGRSETAWQIDILLIDSRQRWQRIDKLMIH